MLGHGSGAIALRQQAMRMALERFRNAAAGTPSCGEKRISTD